MDKLNDSLDALLVFMKASCARMVKLDSDETLLNRILEKEVPSYYLEITKQELLKRRIN